MNAVTIAPLLLVKIRDVSEDKNAPWRLLDTAATEEQAASKITRHRLPSTVETAVVPNVIAETPAPVVSDTPETLAVLEDIQKDNATLRRENLALHQTVAVLRAAKAPKPSTESAAVAAPLPFSVGAILKDIHSGKAVRVVAINPPHPKTGTPRAGFNWAATDGSDASGFVPAISAGAFVTPATESN